MLKYMYHSDSDVMFIVTTEEEYEEVLENGCVEVDEETFNQYKEDLRGL